MKKIIIIALFSMLGLFSYGQSAYQEALKEMFTVSGSEASYKTVINQMFDVYKSQRKDVPTNVWNEFRDEMLNTSIDELAKLLEPVYKKYLTITDIEDLTAFYKTPVGKKYATCSSKIMQESMEVGKKWGYELGKNFEKKLKERGY